MACPLSRPITWCPSLISCGCLPGPFPGRLPLPHRVRPALLPGLVRRTRPGPAHGPPLTPRAVHPVDAGDPPVQALHRLPTILGHRRVLPDLRHRWPARAFTRRARPPAIGTCGVTDARVHPPTVRGPAHPCPGISQPIRFRAGSYARPAGFADLRSRQRRRRRSQRGTWATRCCGYAARAPRSC